MNKYHLFLESACGDNAGFRSWMGRPFVIGQHAVSTNAHVMCMIPIRLSDHEYKPLDNEKTEHGVESALYGFKHAEGTIPLSVLNAIEESCPEIDETIIEDESVECEACDGSGEVEWHFSYDTDDHYRDFECPVCDGSGLMDKEVVTHTGKTIKDPNALCSLFGIRFRYEIVTFLIRLARMENKDVELVGYKKQGDLLKFQCGEVILIICPVNDKETKTFYDYEQTRFI
jgi:hypothetical protein